MDQETRKRLDAAVAENNWVEASAILAQESAATRALGARAARFPGHDFESDARTEGSRDRVASELADELAEDLRRHRAEITKARGRQVEYAGHATSTSRRAAPTISFKVVVLDAEGDPVRGAVVRVRPGKERLGLGVQSDATNVAGEATFQWDIADPQEGHLIVIALAAADAHPNPPPQPDSRDDATQGEQQKPITSTEV